MFVWRFYWGEETVTFCFDIFVLLVFCLFVLISVFVFSSFLRERENKKLSGKREVLREVGGRGKMTKIYFMNFLNKT